MTQRFPLRQAVLASAVAAALALPAVANTGAAGTTGQQSPTAQSAGGERTQAQQRQTSSAIQAQTRDDVRLNKAIGMEVRDRAGQKVGTLRDLVIDFDESRLRYAVLQPEGSDQFYALQLRAFSLAEGEQHLVIDSSRQDFDRVRGFESADRWPGMADAEYWSQIRRQLGMEMATELRHQQTLRRASDLAKTEIVGRAGGHIGELRDAVVNLNNGKVHYVVANLRGIRMPNSLVALPLGALEPSYGRDALMLSLSPEQIAQLPSFSEDRWPELADSGFRDSLNRILVIVVQRAGAAQAIEGRQEGVIGMQQSQRQTEQTMTGVQGRSPLQDPGIARQQDGTQSQQASGQQQEPRPMGRGVAPPEPSVQSPTAEQVPQPLGQAPQLGGPDAMKQAQTPATAAPDIDRPFTEENFKQLDRDADGRISGEEARMDPTFMAAWHLLDRNKNGFVTMADVQHYREQQKLR